MLFSWIFIYCFHYNKRTDNCDKVEIMLKYMVIIPRSRGTTDTTFSHCSVSGLPCVC